PSPRTTPPSLAVSGGEPHCKKLLLCAISCKRTGATYPWIVQSTGMVNRRAVCRQGAGKGPHHADRASLYGSAFWRSLYRKTAVGREHACHGASRSAANGRSVPKAAMSKCSKVS